jgi:hypothetical protein
MLTLTARFIAGRFFALPSYEARGTPFPVMMLLNWTVSGRLVMSWRQSIALTLLVGLLTVTGLWILVLVAVPISGAFSLMAEKRRQPDGTVREAGGGRRLGQETMATTDRPKNEAPGGRMFSRGFAD